MHRVLERQIKRFLKELPTTMVEEWTPFFEAISETYAHADDDRALLTHSLEISSKEFVELNKKLRSENEIIEARVRERTAELEAERAKQIEVDKAKDQFMAIASHEMRTPLAVIRGNAELLLGDQEIVSRADLKEESESILRSSIRMLGIVNDFLDVQHLETGKMVLRPALVDIVALLRESVGDLTQVATEKDVVLAFAPPQEQIPPMQLDSARLQQIFVNLIANGIHYTQQGSITVSIQKREGSVQVRFADTGVGIDEEDKARLFKKFQIGKAVVPSKEFGSGLGLYISNMLAKLMGGEVKLESSTPGKGSTFSLTLPVQ